MSTKPARRAPAKVAKSAAPAAAIASNVAPTETVVQHFEDVLHDIEKLPAKIHKAVAPKTVQKAPPKSKPVAIPKPKKPTH
jgi:hypothetical protein